MARAALGTQTALVPLLLLALAILAVAALALWRANELFVLSARRGKVLLLRGALPRALERELSALLRQAGATGRLRALRQGGQARLVGRGLGPDLEQRLRNVFFASRFAKLRWLAGRDPRPRNLGQRLGWEWLAWRLAGEPGRGALRAVPPGPPTDEESNGALRDRPHDAG